MSIRYFVVAGLLAVAFQAHSAEGQDVCLNWQRPLKNTDGTTLPASTPLVYKIYRGAKGSPVKAFVVQSSALAACIPNQSAGEWCYELTAVAAGDESAHTGEACKIVRFPGPTDGKIEAPSDGTIEQ